MLQESTYHDMKDRRHEASGKAEDPQEQALSLLDICKLLFDNRALILRFIAAASVLTLIITLIQKPYYKAEATFLPPNTMSTGSMSAALSQLGVLGAAGGALGGFKDPSQVYIGILNSRTVADNLIHQFDLAKVYSTKKLSQTEKVLRSHTKIVSSKDSIVVINFEDHDPNRAADIANAYLDALRKQNDRIAFTEAGQKRVFFQDQLEKEKNELANAEVEMARMQESSGLIQPTGQAQLQFQAVARTQAEITAREVELAAISQGATDQNPNVVRLRSEIQSLRNQLASLERSNEQSGKGDIQVSTANMPKLTLDYIRNARDVKYHEALYELLLRQFETAKLDEARSAPLVQIIDTAVVPDSKAGLGRFVLTLLAGVVGAILGSAWVLAKVALRWKF